MKKVSILSLSATAVLLISIFIVSSEIGKNRTRPAEAARSVSDSERALVWMQPYDGDYSKVGAYLGTVYSSAYSQLAPDAIKLPHGLCQHIQRNDSSNLQGQFPYSKLQAYNDAEVAAGRDPIFVTATYQGKKRPVVFTIWRDIDPMYAVNAADERYIDFFLNEFIKKIVYPGATSFDDTMWFHCDTGMFSYNYYGVYDDNGNYVTGVKWDEPFPQNQQEFQDMIKTFFKRIGEKGGPHLLVNKGGIPMEYMEYVWSEIPGSLHERAFDYEKTSSYERGKWLELFQFWQMMRRDHKPVIFYTRGSDLSDTDRIRTYYIAYQIVRGDNFFHALRMNGGNTDLPPSAYQYISDALGEAVAEPQYIQESGKSSGYTLYYRKMSKGMIYLNQTGATKTVQLPTDRPYYGRNGNRVTSITIPDMRGDYVTTTSVINPSPDPNYNVADINRDGKVNLLDYVLLFENFGKTGSNAADLNNDSKVNILDFVILFENFGKSS